MARWVIVIAALALIVLAVTQAAPAKDAKPDTAEDAAPSKNTDTSEPDVKPAETVSSEEEKASEQVKEGAVSKEETEVEEGSGLASNEKEEQVVDTKEEAPNNQDDTEGANDNDVTNDHNEGSYTGSFGDNFEEYRLSERDAEELLRELSDPAEVALFIMESDDVNGFLRSVQMLLDQGFISDEYAFFLKEAVSEQLDQLLMLQNEELYEDPLVMQTAEDAGNDYVNELLNKPVPYFPEDYFDNTMPYEDTADLYPEPDYGMIQQPYSEETMVLAEIANIIADQIENGQMSTERGERIIDILSQLLPGTFWQDDEVPEEMMGGLGEAFADLYPPMPVMDEDEQYRTYEAVDDEPLPGGARHTETEVVVDSEGRPVAETVKEEAEQVLGDELTGDEAQEAEGELEKELLGMEPEVPDDVEEALQDVDKLATAEKESTKEVEEGEEEIHDDLDKDEWKDLVLLLEGGEISDALMKELGLTSQDILDLTDQLEAVDKEKP